MNTITICTVTFNDEFFLKFMLNNTLPYVDHIVLIDNMSRDGTHELISGLSDKYPGKIIYSRSDKYMDESRTVPWNEIDSRNEAFEIAEQVGDTWSIILDADEILLPSFYTRLRSAHHSIARVGIFNYHPLLPHLLEYNYNLRNHDIYDGHHYRSDRIFRTELQPRYVWDQKNSFLWHKYANKTKNGHDLKEYRIDHWHECPYLLHLCKLMSHEGTWIKANRANLNDQRDVQWYLGAIESGEIYYHPNILPADIEEKCCEFLKEKSPYVFDNLSIIFDRARNFNHCKPTIITASLEKEIQHVAATDEEIDIIVKVCKSKSICHKVTEFGTHYGVSGSKMARLMPYTPIYSVDFTKRPIVSGQPMNMFLLHCNTLDVAKKFDYLIGNSDVVFIDGDHSYDHALQDFFVAESILAQNGTIIIHDVLNPECTGLTRLMKEIIATGKYYHTVHKTKHGLLVLEQKQPKNIQLTIQNIIRV